MNLATTLKLVEFEHKNPVRPGLELFSEIATSLVAGFKQTTENLAAHFKRAEGQYLGLSGDVHKAQKSLQTRDYSSMMEISVPVPIGFKGDLIAYGRFLVSSADQVSEYLKAIDSLKRTISFMLTNPTMVVDVNKGIMSQEEVSNIKTKYLEESSQYISDEGSSTKTLGDCIARNVDWETVVKIATELDHYISKHSNRSLLNDADEIDRLLGKLVERQRSGKLSNVSLDTVRELSASVYTIAIMLEFYAVNFYRAMAYVHSVEEIGKKINFVTKGK